MENNLNFEQSLKRLEEIVKQMEQGNVVNRSGKGMAGEFVGEVPAFARIFAEQSADHKLGVTVVVGIRRVEVVDAALDRTVDHFFGECLVDAAVGICRQTHCTESQH